MQTLTTQLLGRTARKRPQGLASQHGFTLVEMLIAIAASLILMAGVTQVFIAHSQNYSQQDDVAVMQQNLRGVLMLMPSEMRLAGCDPEETGEPGIITATPTRFEFQADIGRQTGAHRYMPDGKIDAQNEQIAYIFDSTVTPPTLFRQTMSNTGNFSDGDTPRQPLADNIERLEFSYVLENGDVVLEPRSKDMGKIRAVQISMLARSANPAQGNSHVHAGSFRTAFGTEWSTTAEGENRVLQDGHRRKLVITTVQLRNMAVEHITTTSRDDD